MTAPALRLTTASRRFGSVQALDQVDLTLAAGERVALLGPNGAGKTTLMRAISGHARLDQGSASIAGAPAGSLTARRRLGLVPQRIALYPALTVRENLEVFGRLHGMAPADLAERVTGALEWTDLTDRAPDPVAQLSGGMQRRLNVACGCLHEPALLLLDEPTVGIDAGNRERIQQMLNGLRDQGVTVLESTHQIDDVEATCDRVLIMHQGRLLASGSVADLIRATQLTEHTCRITLDRAPESLALAAGFQLRGATVTGQVRDLARELGALLSHIQSAGLDVREVQIDPPHLEDVFAHLTGGATPQ